MFKITVGEARKRLQERGIMFTWLGPTGERWLVHPNSFAETHVRLMGVYQTALNDDFIDLKDDDEIDAEYQPQALDKGCYWIFCVPVPPDEVGWKWAGQIWRKNDDRPFTEMFKRTIEDIEIEAARWMKCDEPKYSARDMQWAQNHVLTRLLYPELKRNYICRNCGLPHPQHHIPGDKCLTCGTPMRPDEPHIEAANCPDCGRELLPGERCYCVFKTGFITPPAPAVENLICHNCGTTHGGNWHPDARCPKCNHYLHRKSK